MKSFMEAVDRASERACGVLGNYDRVAEAVGLKNRGSLNTARKKDGGIGIDRALKIAEIARWTPEEVLEMEFLWIQRELEKTASGRAAYAVLEEMVRQSPKARRPDLKRDLVAAWREFFKGN